MAQEVAKVVVREEAVLEKFDGEPEDGVLAERITLVNGEVIKHEFFENGEVVRTIEGGNNGTN
jgi:hypothetical protein